MANQNPNNEPPLEPMGAWFQWYRKQTGLGLFEIRDVWEKKYAELHPEAVEEPDMVSVPRELLQSVAENLWYARPFVGTDPVALVLVDALEKQFHELEKILKGKV